MRKCDRGPNCKRRKQLNNDAIMRNNATNTFVIDRRKNGIVTQTGSPEPLFLEHLI